MTVTYNGFPHLPTIYEMCPHCGQDVIITGWDVSIHGFEATCPYCGERIALCDECLNGDDPRPCDWDNKTKTCNRKQKQTDLAARLKEELRKAIIPRSVHDPERANLDSDDVWDIIDKVFNQGGTKNE